MAIQCSLLISGDYALVSSSKGQENVLRFDLTKANCRLYENARQQGKEFYTEIIRWCGGNIPNNGDELFRSILFHLMVRRREMGLAM